MLFLDDVQNLDIPPHRPTARAGHLSNLIITSPLRVGWLKPTFIDTIVFAHISDCWWSSLALSSTLRALAVTTLVANSSA